MIDREMIARSIKIMDSLLSFVFVLSTMVVICDGKLCNLTFTSEISIAKDGRQDVQCLKGSFPCPSLDFVFDHMMMINNSYLRHSIKLDIQSDQSLNRNHNLSGLTELALCGGQLQERRTSIQCEHGIGLLIELSENITMEHLEFRNCGSTQITVSQDIGHALFYTAIHIMNTVNVVVNDCVIVNSIGIGMTLFDVGGLVKFIGTNFLENRGCSSRINASSRIIQSGGGLYIDFTYSGGSPPFKPNNNSFHFQHCLFSNNNATWEGSYHTNIYPEKTSKNNTVIFGCGGGMGMGFKKDARDNVVLIEDCIFEKNVADWGGAYQFLFQDKSQDNYIHLRNVKAVQNYARFSGGGGRFGFFPQVMFDNLFKTPGNYFMHDNCTFYGNRASWGGGIGIYGTTTFLASNNTNHTTLLFTNCHWIENEAIVGSAVGLLSDWRYPTITEQLEGKGVAYIVQFVNCTIEYNIILNNIMNIANNVIGTGALYTDIAPVVMENVSLFSNNGTALVLDWSSVKIIGNVSFCGNSGSRGGAIALYGRSVIILDEDASLVFHSNRAFLQGGAIYARSQGPNLKAFNIRFLDRSACFFSYTHPNKLPDSWRASVSFYNNTAPAQMGDSVYADTLQFCRNYGNFSELLEWRNFHYNPLSNSRLEIVTDPITISTNKSSWRAYPGQKIFPEIELQDEKGQPANGLLRLSILPKENSALHLGNGSSHYIYVSVDQGTTPITLESQKLHDQFDIILSSVYTQMISTTVGNLSTLGSCYAGYTFHEEEQKCVCLKDSERSFGYSHCGNDGKTIFLKPEYWGYIDSKGKFSTWRCPRQYCYCKNKSDTGECVFEMFSNEKTGQCQGNRSGHLCGSCMEGYSVVTGSQECQRCSNTGILWLLLTAAGLTVAVLGIIYFKLDFFSGPLNSWLYTYHIIAILTQDSDVNFDPFMTFIIGLTQGVFDTGEGICFWDGMDELQKNSLRNFMPFYCLFLIYLINKFLHCFPNNRLATNSVHQALVTIVIISYASLLQNTTVILQPAVIDDKWYVYIQASQAYFGYYHSCFAIPAIIILVFFVLPFPFVIAFNSFFTRHFNCLRNFIPLFQVLQSPYRDKHSWFASYYIFCRIIFIVIGMGRPIFPRTELAIWEFASVLVLMVFVLLRPYNEDNECYFIVDTLFLTLLCSINCIQIASRSNMKNLSVYNCVIQIVTYVPFIYSVALLMLYVRKKYRERQYNELNN